MAETEKDGGPAFPAAYGQECPGCGKMMFVPASCLQEGMSLRDWFAGQALNGFLSDASFMRTCMDTLGSVEGVKVHTAYLAYSYADALLAARKREKPGA